MWRGSDDGSVNESRWYKRRETYGHDKLQHSTFSQKQAAEKDQRAKRLPGVAHISQDRRLLPHGEKHQAESFKTHMWNHESDEKVVLQGATRSHLGLPQHTCSVISLISYRQQYPKTSVKSSRDANAFISILPNPPSPSPPSLQGLLVPFAFIPYWSPNQCLGQFPSAQSGDHDLQTDLSRLLNLRTCLVAQRRQQLCSIVENRLPWE